MKTSVKLTTVAALLAVTVSSAHAMSIFSKEDSTPTINTHLHWNGSYADKEAFIMSQLDNRNVDVSLVMPWYWKGSSMGDKLVTEEEMLEVVKRYPGRFYLLYSLQRNKFKNSKNWDKPGFVKKTVKDMEEHFESGMFYGSGELLLRHFGYGPRPEKSEVDMPPTSLLSRAIFKVSAKYDKPIVIHMEAEPDNLFGLSEVMNEFPKTRVVWAHNCGRMSSEEVGKWLSKYPQLSCDLSNMNEHGFYGAGKPRMEHYTHLTIKENPKEQIDLMNRFPDRFMIGSDCCHSPGLKKRKIENNISELQELISGMDPKIQRMIKRENAIRIFKLPVK